ADIDEILTLMKRGMAGGKDMPPSTSRLIQKEKAADGGITTELKLKAMKREASLKEGNRERQRAAHSVYKRIQDSARELEAAGRGPSIGMEDFCRRIKAKDRLTESTRTIRRALRPENKV